MHVKSYNKTFQNARATQLNGPVIYFVMVCFLKSCLVLFSWTQYHVLSCLVSWVYRHTPNSIIVIQFEPLRLLVLCQVLFDSMNKQFRQDPNREKGEVLSVFSPKENVTWKNLIPFKTPSLQHWEIEKQYWCKQESNGETKACPEMVGNYIKETILLI